MSVQCRRGIGETWALAILIAAAFSVSTAYGIFLPRLSAILAGLPSAHVGAAWRMRELAGVTAAYFAAALVGAPIAGALSDRVGRGGVLAAAGLAFAAGFLGAPSAHSVIDLSVSLVLTGLATGAVEPVALAYVADRWRDPDLQARRFAWVIGAVRAGYLAGPLMGELAQPLGPHMPFILPAAVGALAGTAALTATRGSVVRADREGRQSGRVGDSVFVLLLSAVAAGAAVVLEVAYISPLGGTAPGQAAAALLLTICAAVMLLAQTAIFAGRKAAARGPGLIRPLLLLLAGALIATPFAHGLWQLAAIVTATAIASAALTALASFLAAQASPAAHGRGLGLQFAAIGGGQMLAAALSSSSAGGGPASVWIAAAAAAGLAILGGSAGDARA